MPLVRKIKCVVDTIEEHGGQVYTLNLIPENQAPVFKPGQFLHLAIDAYDPSGFWPDSRVFSIASSPSDRSHLKIVFSVKGKFTGRMEKELTQGSEVWVKLPYGDFVIGDANRAVLIAGGTGLTAFTAFLDGLLPERKQEVTLYYAARNWDLLIFKPLIDLKAKEVEALSVIYLVEEGQTNEAERIQLGRPVIPSILQKISDPQNVDYYLSGPPAMLKKLSLDLKEKGINPENIKIDAWE